MKALRLALIASVALTALVASRYLATSPDDDAFITFRYVENMLHGRGMVYNAHEHVLGTTTPLFTLLLYPGPLAGISVASWSMALCTIFLVLSGVLVFALVSAEVDLLAGFAAALFVVLNPWLLQSFGNEMLLHIVLHLAVFYCLFHGRYNLAAISAALAALNRGDGLVIGGMLFAYRLAQTRRLPLRELAVYGVTLAPWMLFSFFYFGGVAPSTLDAKIGQGASGLFPKFLDFTVRFLRNPVLAHPALAGVYALSAIGGLVTALRRPRLLFVVGWVALFFAGYWTLGVSFALRYFIPTTFGLFLLAGCGLSEMAGWFNGGLRLLAPRFHLRLFGATVCLLAVVPLLGTEVVIAREQKQAIARSGRGEIYTAAGEWLRQHAGEATSVAAVEIGFIGYFADRTIVDFCGLVTPPMVQNVRRGDFESGFVEFQPDYFVYNPEFSSWFGLTINSEWFRRSYDAVQTIPYDSFAWSPLTIFKKVQQPAFDLYVGVDQSQASVDTTAGKIFGSREVGQSFLATRNGLTQVELLIATYGVTRTADLEVELRQSDGSGAPVRRLVLKGEVLPDNSWHTFAFEPLPDSAGRHFTLALKAPGLSEEEAITIWASSANSYKDGALVVDGQEVKGDLSFRTRARLEPRPVK